MDNSKKEKRYAGNETQKSEREELVEKISWYLGKLSNGELRGVLGYARGVYKGRGA